jgi:hypothetical protein
VPEPELRKMLTTNAAELFGFDLAELRPLGDTFGPTPDELRVPLSELPANADEVLLKGLAGTASGTRAS